jgi:Fic family protein
VVVQGGAEGFSAFHPRPLPPDPPLAIDARLQSALDRANQALGRLDGVAMLLPDPDLLLYAYVRKEAVLSSQIEGTQSSLSDLLLFEHEMAPGVPIDDARETSSYVAAMGHGLRRLDDGFPLSLRLIREMHAHLMRHGRGSDAAPGEFRSSQNWIGGSSPGTARFVPPPAHEVMPAMGSLERFLHDEPEPTPVLIKAALAHAQFETIHPFLDGNGRVGRLLITLMLCAEGALSRPLLYLSLYLKAHRTAYYDHLQRIRTEGAWEEWVRFFVDGVAEVAGSTTAATREIVRFEEDDRAKIRGLGRSAGSALGVHALVMRRVIITARDAAREIGVASPAAYRAIANLEELGILREITGRRRDRVYAHDRYLALLSEGID